jgi:organic hydroperoxide reductase OsmC/OhrA
MSSPTHMYRTVCSWTGSTAGGYEHYSRRHVAYAPPAECQLELSADTVFRGEATLLNPEQLVVVAASSCQLLSFLALAARASVNVISYTDEAEAIMPEDDLPVRITTIALRPIIVVEDGTDLQRVALLIERAHELCYIANTLNAEIRIDPKIRYA